MKATIAIASFAAAVSLPHPATAPREVEIVGLDYAFKAPNELAPGRTTFRFVNRGKVRHEFNIVLLKRGATVQQLIAAANADKPVEPMIDATIGVLFATPGSASPSALSTELLAGRTYAIRCIFKDGATAPRHQALGMYSAIHVLAGTPVAPAAPAPLRVDTIVGMDYAFRYSSTMSPGVHHLAFVNAGKQRHQVAVALLRKGVTPQKVFEVDKAGGDVGALLEQDLGLLHSPAGRSPLGLLQVHLLPGRTYMIECAFSDTPKSKPHYELGMFGSIRVTGAAPAGPGRAPPG